MGAAIPLIPMSPIDLQLIDYALVVYLALLRRKGGKIPLPLAINVLRPRIVAMILPIGEEQPLLITEGELIVILSALAAYIDTLCTLIPPSKARDDVVAIFESIRSRLVRAVFPEPDKPTTGAP
jgi:hypothetical protein